MLLEKQRGDPLKLLMFMIVWFFWRIGKFLFEVVRSNPLRIVIS